MIRDDDLGSAVPWTPPETPPDPAVLAAAMLAPLDEDVAAAIMFSDVMGGVAVQVDRLQSQAMPVKAIALREDVWPGVTSVLGYPVARLAASSPVRWGVIT